MLVEEVDKIDDTAFADLKRQQATDRRPLVTVGKVDAHEDGQIWDTTLR